jgi:glutaredoxin 3
MLSLLSVLSLTLPSVSMAFHSPSRSKLGHEHRLLTIHAMKRPILDQIATALYRLETSRVEASSKLDDDGRYGEPMEWSESNSLPNLVSEWIASNPLGYMFKQMVADLIAGNDYDKDATMTLIESFISENKVAMFSFTSCPFCRKAKDLLVEKGIEFQVMELDQLEGNLGNQIRSCLGRKTKRTSVPSIFIGGKYIGGCNDGPGLLTLDSNGTLDQLIADL